MNDEGRGATSEDDGEAHITEERWDTHFTQPEEGSVIVKPAPGLRPALSFAVYRARRAYKRFWRRGP